MKPNKKIQTLYNKAEKEAKDSPLEDEVAECYDFAFDFEGYASGGVELADFVIANPDFAMVEVDHDFLYLWKDEASAVKKLEALIAKALSVPKY